MGLDMYLKTSSKRIAYMANDTSDALGAHYAKAGTAIYWRKANAIHRWFVENVQDGVDDCGIYPVEAEDLVKLHDACREVLESTRLVDADVKVGERLENGRFIPILKRGKRLEDTAKAREILPTADGFFFGSTDYDQWYWLELEETMKKTALILDCLEPDGEFPWRVTHRDEPDWFVNFEYTSSW
jgi:hypothetical protein